MRFCFSFSNFSPKIVLVVPVPAATATKHAPLPAASELRAKKKIS